MYTHALPEGYMLKSTMDALMKMQQEEDVDKGLEFKIEEERAKLNPDDLTKVTKESFEAWHKKRRATRMAAMKKRDQAPKSKQGVFLTGKALMKYDETLFKNDEEGGDDDEEEVKYAKKKDEDDEDVFELRFGLDDEEEETNKDIAAARKKQNIDADLFEDAGADDLDLDDLE
jgi:hypothetical protein